ncbi:AsmA family protein [Sphingomonas sp. Leaf357]|uniref:AsmA family protein n=1 Tax=Sphingomonas sp. Leaf357 TaxID=1736350 RepID=UPI001F3B30FC|nr:AsmA family protein [Sphingomonas sp. Leaf357]
MTIRTFLADRRLHRAAGGIAVLAGLLLILLAAFPWGLLKSTIEARLSERFGRTVTIGSIDRLDRLSFTPTIAIRDVRVPQPGWAGSGDLARIARVDMRFRALPLLLGRFSPETIGVSGMRLALVRTADKRENWRSDSEGPGGGSGPDLTGLTIADSMISYADAKADRSFTAALTADSVYGLRVSGSGKVRGSPVRIALSGAAIEGAGGKRWPFRAILDGPALGMQVRGTMAAPLDTHRMTIDIAARADDLRMIDAIVEAGLFGTQPVRLTAHVRRDAPDWTIDTLKGTIGRSDLSGRLTVRKRDGRTKLDGDVVFGTLDFDDLSSDEGLARGRALERRIGPKLVPTTRINLGKITRTDGVLSVTARRIVDDAKPSSLTWLKGRIALDHQVLILAPLQVGLKTGTISGSVRVDQHGGTPEPLVTIDLALRNGTVAALAGGADAIDGRVEGRARLTGTGSTIREVVGRSNGRIGLIAHDGSLPEKIAALIGFDAGRALTAGKGSRATLRCAALRLDLRGGVGRVDPLVIDTSASGSHGAGTVSFPSEALAIRLTGAPKKDSVLRLPGSVTLGGTIRAPSIVIPQETKSAGNILKAIGRAITGRQGPIAGDANCAALSARALGN